MGMITTTEPSTDAERAVAERALEQGYLLVRATNRDLIEANRGAYVLVQDCAGNRRDGGQAAVSAFLNGDGDDLDGIEQELAALSV